ncbi:hypothetical protein J416_09639 [Gracilibacillus halophilus YIM-C55.5]|uniref:Uncharacterized protein n=1 Tax=Gracilibacillus halophilus YIM-C55.5 TaxID=1308866 RepID=N4WBK8_9BACI|nr:hypothetical protein [Gracilibacillus halophilus]ENH96629.1 hypothetical protein J416_09639 [Gracilibacillus halophilus YIM-C55.5]
MSKLLEFVPERIVIICTILAFLFPYIIHKINQLLHKNGDPPWKKNKS